MNPSPRFPGQNTTSVALRLVVWIGIWILLTTVAHAAETAHESHGVHLLHVLGLNLATVLTAVWVFVLGACIGSFLNVVIYRMPAGVALSHPPSRCPSCETELTARDNIPILGWITLKGRCRHCGVAISSRYPLIESVVGLLFLAVLLVETTSGGANLPFPLAYRYVDGPLEAVLGHGRWDLLASFGLHVFYLTLVLAVCMIAYDGFRPPRRLVWLGVAVPLVVGVLWPALRPVHAVMPVPDAFKVLLGGTLHLPTWLGGGTLRLGLGLVGVIDGACGLVSGLLTGWLAARAQSGDSVISAALRSVFLLAGACCGWQLTWPLLATMLVVIAVMKLLRSKSLQTLLPLLLFGMCSLLMLCWGGLLNGIVLIRHDGWRWTGAATWIDWTVTIAGLTALALVLSRWNPSEAAADEAT